MSTWGHVNFSFRNKKVTEFGLPFFHCCVCKNTQLKITTAAYGETLNHHCGCGVWKNIQLKITYSNWLKQSIPHFTQWKKFSLPPTLVELSGYMIRNQLNNLYIGESFFCAHLHMPQSMQWYYLSVSVKEVTCISWYEWYKANTKAIKLKTYIIIIKFAYITEVLSHIDSTAYAHL